ELQALADVRRARLEVRVEEDATVAISFTPETKRHLEIFVILGGLQISILTGNGFSVNSTVLDRPFLVSHFNPAAEITAVEDLHPLFIGQLRLRTLGGGRDSHQRHAKYE